MTDKHEAMARELEATGEYRILRRFRPKSVYEVPDSSATKIGILLDLETTGLDSSRHEIIEMAMVPFTYSNDGRIFEVRTPFLSFNEPSAPIPPEITTLTGITDEMVRGHRLDPAEVAAFANQANLIVAHNAGFDRRFAEKVHPIFAQKPWACSVTQVPWDAEGFDGAKLKYLAAGCGFFFEGHRASDDCLATIEVLARPLKSTGRPAFATLLEEARRPTVRILALSAPFESKDVLKARGYRWSDGSDGRAKAWYRDVAEDAVDAEIAMLEEHVFFRKVQLPKLRLTAKERFSERA
jgi:DNA polymerase-3 subunit epsilon